MITSHGHTQKTNNFIIVKAHSSSKHTYFHIFATMVAKERGVEWSINMGDGTSKVLTPECSSESRIWRCLQGFMSKIRGFFERAWRIAVNEPKKVMHCVKVGLALSLVSLFYYMRPLYDGVGGNAMWAVMTVVVVFEYTVGRSLSLSLSLSLSRSLL